MMNVESFTLLGHHHRHLQLKGLRVSLSEFCQSFVGQESLPNVSLFSFFHELSESFNEKARPKA